MRTSHAPGLACLLAAAGLVGSGAIFAGYAPVIANQPLIFPADYGSHPQFRTEWWYVTGWLTTDHGESLGFQITFFRAKPDIDEHNPSSFAPHQLLIAHCAISDPKHGRLWQDQRIRRAGFGLAGAATGDAHVWIDRWSLNHDAAAYTAKIARMVFWARTEQRIAKLPRLSAANAATAPASSFLFIRAVLLLRGFEAWTISAKHIIIKITKIHTKKKTPK
jgi:predicted secreted hydrolase